MMICHRAYYSLSTIALDAKAEARSVVSGLAELATTDQENGTLIVGRSLELASAIKWLERLPAGRGMVGLIRGPSGVGKTSLLKEILAAATARGYCVVENLRSSGNKVASARPLLSKFGEFLLADASQHREAGGHLLEVAIETMQIAWRELNAPTTNIGSVLSVLGKVLRLELARLIALCPPTQPIVMLFDDIDHVDSATRILIEALGTAIEPYPIALIASFTLPVELEESDPLCRMCELRHPLAKSLTLTPLDLDSARELIERRTDGSLSCDAVACLHRAAGGSPDLLLAMVTTLFS